MRLLDWSAVAAIVLCLGVPGSGVAATLVADEHSPVALALGSAPIDVTAADLDGDWRVDLAVPGEATGAVSVLLRSSGGGYAPALGSPFAVGDLPAASVAADFDGDGRSDLAVANYETDDVSVLLAHAGGGLAAEAGSPVTVGDQPTSIATGDFNGDDRPDLVVTNSSAGSVTVLIRQAAGGFSAQSTAVGATPYDVVVADFDRDGRQDLAVSGYQSEQLRVLLGQPAGTFTLEAGSPIDLGAVPFDLAAGDFNADSRPDLAVTLHATDQVAVLERRATGGFVAEAGSPYPAGDAPYAIAAADFDRDGYTDLAIGNDTVPSTATLLRRTPDQRFAPAFGSPLPTGSRPLGLTTADLNGDGRIDLLSADYGADTISLFDNVIETTITGGPDGTTADNTPSFTFAADEPGATFQCRTDQLPFGPCDSGNPTNQLTDGPHNFDVRAIDRLNNPDPTPARRTFTVNAPARPPGAPPLDTIAPETTITSGPANGAPVNQAAPLYAFSSNEPGSRFECRDYEPHEANQPEAATPYRACTSPQTVADAVDRPAITAFEVRAIDPAGNTDATPDVRRVVKHGKFGAPAKPSECRMVAVERTHGKRMLPGCRLARIIDGKVPCLHVETLQRKTCRFKRTSGRWLESKTGPSYAMAGESISRKGSAQGRWIVAAKRSSARTVPCAKPPPRKTATKSDTAGRVSGSEELIRVCVVEEMGQEWNSLSAYGYAPLVNYATREVCTSNHPGLRPHPDGAALVRTEGNVFCYTSDGAGLNDINGIERDNTGHYIPGEQYCHDIVSDGYVVPAAKRPATKSLPAPGVVNTKTHIAWRPVAPDVAIAN